MDKELKGIDRYLKNLRIPEADNKEHKKELRQLLASDAAQAPKATSILSFPIVKYALPLAAVLIVILGLVLILPGIWRPEPTVNIVAMQGNVYERSTTGNKTREVEEQGQFTQGAILSTGKDSTLTFAMGKNTVVTVLESSQIELRALEYSNTVEKSLLFLSNGKIECLVEMPGTESMFDVLTEYTRIRVYGTKFSVQVMDNKDVIINVEKGIVQVDNFYKADKNITDLKDMIPAIEKELDEFLNKSTVLVSKQQQLRIDYKIAGDLNIKLQDLLEQISAVHLSPNIDDQEKALGFNEILHNIREGVDPVAFELQSLQESSDNENKGESDTVLPEVKTEAGDSVTDSEASIQTADAETKPRQIVFLPMNSGVEQGQGIPSGWYKSENTAVLSWTDEVAHAGDRSIKIASTDKREHVCAWAYTVTTGLPVGKQLTLTVHLKTVDVKGQGVCVALRADDTPTADDKAEMYATTQGKKIIKGSHDWTEYSISFSEPLSFEIKSVTVYLIFLPDTKGSVYFDDITLSYKE